MTTTTTLTTAQPAAPSFAGHRSRARAWLDPRTKLAALLLLNPVAFSISTTGLATWARLAAMMVIAGLWLSLRRWRPLFGFVLAYAMGWGLVALGRELPGQWALIGGVGTLVLLILPVTALAAYCVTSTQLSELVAALERLRVPPALLIPLSVVFRFIPTIAEEHGAIGDAMRMRGIGLRARTRNPVALLEYRVVPLLMSLVRIGDELSAAALTRGLGGPNQRSVVCQIGFGWRDGVVCALAVVPPAIWLAGMVVG